MTVRKIHIWKRKGWKIQYTNFKFAVDFVTVYVFKVKGVSMKLIIQFVIKKNSWSKEKRNRFFNIISLNGFWLHSYIYDVLLAYFSKSYWLMLSVDVLHFFKIMILQLYLSLQCGYSNIIYEYSSYTNMCKNIKIKRIIYRVDCNLFRIKLNPFFFYIFIGNKPFT